MESLEYLGFDITRDKILPKKAQIDAIISMAQPKTITELRSFTGMCNVFHWQIKKFSAIMSPLEDLKKKGMHVEKDWTEEHTRAFEKIKLKISKRVGTYRIDWDKELHFCSDASDVGVGAYVFQFDNEGKQRVVHCWSKKLTPAQKNYSTQERECFALIEGLKALQVYVDGRTFDVYMDHGSLRYLMQSRYTRRKMSAWAMELQEYNIRDIVHIPGASNCLSDCLSRLPLLEFINETLTDVKFADTDRHVTKKINKSTSNTGDDFVDAYEDPNYVVNSVGVWKKISRLDEIRAKLESDPLLTKMVSYLKKDLGPDDADYKKIMAMSNHFTLEDGLLYFLHKQRFKPMQKRLCIPECMRIDILHQIHEKGGHQGVNRTYELLHDRFWWENMYKDVCEHIKSCTCRKNKLSSNKFKNLKGEHIVVPNRWHTLAIDWLDIGRRGKYGSTKVLTIVDLFSRFSLGIPANDKSGTTLVRILRMIFGICGYPRRIVSDNESMFKSEAFKEWLIVKGIEKTFTAVYNPQANGIDERFNQTLLNMINSTSVGREWDVDIWDLFYFYNLANHSLTEVSPFFLQYMRKGNLPADLTYNTNVSDDVYTIKDLANKANVEAAKATERMLRLIEKKHGKLDERLRMTKFRPFKVGDKVLVKQPNLATQAKSKPIGTGPWTIHSVAGKNTYKIKDENGKKLKYLVNGRRLALVTPRRKTPKQENNLDYFEMWYDEFDQPTAAQPRDTNKSNAPEFIADLPGGHETRVSAKGKRGLSREAAEALIAAGKEKERAKKRREPARTTTRSRDKGSGK
jgi:hypothetical protein